MPEELCSCPKLGQARSALVCGHLCSLGCALFLGGGFAFSVRLGPTVILAVVVVGGGAVAAAAATTAASGCLAMPVCMKSQAMNDQGTLRWGHNSAIPTHLWLWCIPEMKTEVDIRADEAEHWAQTIHEGKFIKFVHCCGNHKIYFNLYIRNHTCLDAPLGNGLGRLSLSQTRIHTLCIPAAELDSWKQWITYTLTPIYYIRIYIIYIIQKYLSIIYIYIYIRQYMKVSL